MIARMIIALILALSLLTVFAQEAAWDRYMDAAGQAYEQGDYDEAEKQLLRALKEAENFGEKDLRLATSLGNLGKVYHLQGKYAEAEPLYQRSLAIGEKTLGPEHPQVAMSLNNLAGLYRAQGQHAEAEPLYQRAFAISSMTERYHCLSA